MALEAKPIQPRAEFQSILRHREEFATDHQDDVSNQVNRWFDRLMIQSGWSISPTIVLMLCLYTGIAIGGTAFVIQENLLSTAFAFCAGCLIPILVAMIVRSRRQTTMMKQLPAVIEELARAAKTGRSLDDCFQMVAEDAPSPLGDEFQVCARRMQMGTDMATALEDMPERTGLVSLNILATTLVVHQQTGGDLVEVLERLSQTIRDRLLFLGRLRAATIASRATAILMIAIPPLVFTFFAMRDPEYLNNLMASSWGRAATTTAVVLQLVGSIWVLRILKTSQRG